MDAEAAVSLDGLRADYQRLLTMHVRLAQSPLDAERANTHRERALEVAGQWRREDPDNAEIDKLCATLYIDDPDQVGDGEWQPRFSAVVANAERLRKQLK